MAAALVSAALATGTAAGCAGGPAPPDHRPAVEVDKPTALFDEAVRPRITGLPSWETVRVTATTEGPRSRWRSTATFRADGYGVIDLATARPLSGFYEKPDAMGLFWSMRPVRDEVKWFTPPASRQRPAYEVRIAVRSEGEVVAARTVTRVAMADGVRRRSLTVADHGLNGELYLPAEDAPAAAPVLVFGGSEGGNASTGSAALLASRGHPALALCYFGCAGRPAQLEEIAMEYFVRAAEYLLRQDGVRERKLVVMGASRGSEPAQLLGQHHPELVEDVVVFASSNLAGHAWPNREKAAWTRDGRDVVGIYIPLYDVRGTVLGVVGGDDRLWAAETLSRNIAREHRLLVYEKAGHFVSGPPYVPEPLPGPRIGGTQAANAAANADAWPQVLALIRE